MTAIRRPLASCALIVLVLQFALLAGAPVAACCRATPRAVAPQCCKAAPHASGHCPMHPRSERTGTECRMTCANGDSAQLLLVVFGVLPPPVEAQVSLTMDEVNPVRQVLGPSRTSTPDTPPPEARV